MKKIVTVTIEKQIEIEMPDHLLTPEYLKEFSGFMFDVDEPEDMIAYIARQVFYGGCCFIEGVGLSNPSYYKELGEADIYYNVQDEYSTIDIDGETYHG